MNLYDHIFEQKRQALDDMLPTIDWKKVESRPGNARPFDFSSVPFVAYPAPGAAAVDVLVKNNQAFIVPAGMIAVVEYMAISHWGGDIVDGSGNVVWRVLINGAAVRGLHDLESQFASWAQPNPVKFYAVENDVIQVTVEVPAAKAAMPAGDSTSARIRGYLFPISSGGQQ